MSKAQAVFTLSVDVRIEFDFEPPPGSAPFKEILEAAAWDVKQALAPKVSVVSKLPGARVVSVTVPMSDLKSVTVGKAP